MSDPLNLLRPNAERPSFELLMQAEEILGKARDVEKEAGRLGVADLLNSMVISVFQIALSTEIDELADRALELRMEQKRLGPL